jgi:hypothetical protein
MQVLEGVGDEPGFALPTTRRASKDGELQLGRLPWRSFGWTAACERLLSLRADSDTSA